MTLNVAMYKTIQKTKTLNYDYFTKENIKERNPNWPQFLLQRLPIALAQVKAVDTSENLLNGLIQGIYSLHRANDINKNVYNIVMNSTKL